MEIKRFFLTVVCLAFFPGVIRADEGAPVQEDGLSGYVHNVSMEERDPFNVSGELLKRTIAERYVSFSGEGISGLNLPCIEITGIMAVGDKTMATARIESLGEVALKPNEKIVVKSGGSGKKRFVSFLIKEITPSELVIILEGGQEIHGRFR